MKWLCLLLLFCLIYMLPSGFAQGDTSAIEQALSNALPKQSELPSGVVWEAPVYTRGRPGVFWHGENVRYTFGISCELLSGIERRYESLEAFRSSYGSEWAPYAGIPLPGGAMKKEGYLKRLDLPPRHSCTIDFLKSPYGCWGRVSVHQNEKYSGDARASERAEGSVFCRLECERWAHLVWSRLPSGEIGKRAAPPQKTVTFPKRTSKKTTAPPVTTRSVGGFQPEEVEPEKDVVRESPAIFPPITTGKKPRSMTTPGKAAAGAAAVAVVAAGGALLTARAQGVSPREAVTEVRDLLGGRGSEPPSGYEKDGKVWYQPPWDQGGPGWINRDEYEEIKEMQAQGMVWTTRYGWKSGGGLAEAKRSDESWGQANREASAKFHEDLGEEQEELRRKGEESERRVLDKLKKQFIREDMEYEERSRKRWEGYEKRLETVQAPIEVVKTVADETISTVGMIPGPCRYIKYGYKFTTEFAEKGITHGSVWEGVKAGTDALAKDVVADKIGDSKYLQICPDLPEELGKMTVSEIIERTGGEEVAALTTNYVKDKLIGAVVTEAAGDIVPDTMEAGKGLII